MKIKKLWWQCRKAEPSITDGGNITVAAAQELSMEIALKPEGGIAMQHYTVSILGI